MNKIEKPGRYEITTTHVSTGDEVVMEIDVKDKDGELYAHFGHSLVSPVPVSDLRGDCEVREIAA